MQNRYTGSDVVCALFLNVHYIIGRKYDNIQYSYLNTNINCYCIKHAFSKSVFCVFFFLIYLQKFTLRIYKIYIIIYTGWLV